MELTIIDTHAHLDMPEFNSDRDEVINRAYNSGVKRIVTIGIDLVSSQKAIELAEKYPNLAATVGIHPQESKGITRNELNELEKLANNPRVIAIGEMGLDYYRDYSPREDQRQVFLGELEIAQRAGLPIIIHSRQAQEDTLNILQSWSDSYKISAERSRGVIHCFNGDAKIASQYIEMGFFISLGAYIGYPSSAPLRNAIKDISSDRLVIETDCPFLPPQKHRGQRNEPAYTLMTLGVLSEIKQVSIEEMARQTTENAIRLFNLKI